MSVLAVKNRLNDLLRTVGKINLNANYPDEFELYLFAFELLDYSGRSLKYFIFPDNPDAIKEVHSSLSTVEKTLSGVTEFTNPTFNPIPISINGTFGRRLRILVGKQTLLLTAQFVDQQVTNLKTGNKSTKSTSLKSFDTQIKSGYGCIKILQSIMYESKLNDDGKPRTLLFYNLASGNSYVVKIDEFSLDQNNKEANMIWYYSMRMTGIAPADNFSSYDKNNYKNVQQQLAANKFAQDRANNVLSFVNQFINVNDVFRDIKLLDTPEIKNIIKPIGTNNSLSNVSDQSTSISNIFQNLTFRR